MKRYQSALHVFLITLGASFFLTEGSRDDSSSLSSSNMKAPYGSTDVSDNNDVISVTLYLVRHGETEANLKGLVIGQSDSPLTDLGREQAKLLGRSSIIQKTAFWRVYSSDLVRAKETANLILKEQVHSNNNDNNQILPQAMEIAYDPRVRERAKGAKEGLPRIMDYEQAVEEQRKRNPSRALPLFETTDQVWSRCCEFLSHVILNVASSSRNEPKQEQSVDPNVLEEDHCGDNARIPATENNPNILIVSHSGFLRILLQKLLGEETLKRHPQARFEPSTGLFYIPNTSVTVLRIQVPRERRSLDSLTLVDLLRSDNLVSVQELTWADHLPDDMATMNGE